MDLPYYFNNDIGYVTLDGNIVTMLEAYYEEDSICTAQLVLKYDICTVGECIYDKT